MAYSQRSIEMRSCN